MADSDARMRNVISTLAQNSHGPISARQCRAASNEIDRLLAEKDADVFDPLALRISDAEQKAVEWAASQAALFPEFEVICGHAVALRGLLERMRGER